VPVVVLDPGGHPGPGRGPGGEVLELAAADEYASVGTGRQRFGATEFCARLPRPWTRRCCRPGADARADAPRLDRYAAADPLGAAAPGPDRDQRAAGGGRGPAGDRPGDDRVRPQRGLSTPRRPRSARGYRPTGRGDRPEAPLGLNELPDHTISAPGANRFVIPRVQRARVRDCHGPCFSRATGPSDSLAAPPRPKRRALIQGLADEQGCAAVVPAAPEQLARPRQQFSAYAGPVPSGREMVKPRASMARIDPSTMLRS
jgi:hypothetical protein